MEARLTSLFTGLDEPSSPVRLERGAFQSSSPSNEPVLLLPSRIPKRRVIKKWARRDLRDRGELRERKILPYELRPLLHDLIAHPSTATLSRYRTIFENWLVIAPTYTREERSIRKRNDALMQIQERYGNLPNSSQQMLLVEWERRGFDSVLPTNVMGMARLLDRHFPDDGLLPRKHSESKQNPMPELLTDEHVPDQRDTRYMLDSASKEAAWGAYHKRQRPDRNIEASKPNRLARRAERRNVKEERKRTRRDLSMRVAEGATDRRIAAFFQFIDHITPGIEQQSRDERTRSDIRSFMESERSKERRRMWEEEQIIAERAVHNLFRRKAKRVDGQYPFRNTRLVSVLRFAFDEVPDFDQRPSILRDLSVILDSIPAQLEKDARFRERILAPLLFSRSPEGVMAWRKAMKANESKAFFISPATDVDYAARLLRTAHRKALWEVPIHGEPTKGYYRQLALYWLKHLNAAGLPTLAGSIRESTATPELYEYLIDHAGEPAIRSAIGKAYGRRHLQARSHEKFQAPNRAIVDLVELAYRHALRIHERVRLDQDQRVQIIELAWRLVNQQQSLSPVRLFAQSLLASANE